MNDSFNEIDWPENELGIQITNFEEYLKCPICSDPYNNPHQLNCGHNYCSVCIRKYFDRTINRNLSDTCPQCRKRSTVEDLRPNHLLCAISDSYFRFRPKLLNEFLKTQQTSEFEMCRIIDDNTKAKTLTGVAITKRIPHFNFHGMNVAKIKKMISQATTSSKVSLRLDGDKDKIERRFREVVHLHNAQIGAKLPMSFDQVIDQINNLEYARDKASKLDSTAKEEVENIRNGKISKEAGQGFAALLKKARDQRNPSVNKANSEEKSDQPQILDERFPETVSTASLGEYTWGPWRIVMSKKLQRPFFYHVVTGMGQFAVPPELQLNISDHDIEIEECQDDAVHVNMDFSESKVFAMDSDLFVANLEMNNGANQSSTDCNEHSLEQTKQNKCHKVQCDSYSDDAKNPMKVPVDAVKESQSSQTIPHVITNVFDSQLLSPSKLLAESRNVNLSFKSTEIRSFHDIRSLVNENDDMDPVIRLDSHHCINSVISPTMGSPSCVTMFDDDTQHDDIQRNDTQRDDTQSEEITMKTLQLQRSSKRKRDRTNSENTFKRNGDVDIISIDDTHPTQEEKQIVECPNCTYYNQSNAKFCEMCETTFDKLDKTPATKSTDSQLDQSKDMYSTYESHMKKFDNAHLWKSFTPITKDKKRNFRVSITPQSSVLKK